MGDRVFIVKASLTTVIDLFVSKSLSSELSVVQDPPCCCLVCKHSGTFSRNLIAIEAAIREITLSKPIYVCLVIGSLDGGRVCPRTLPISKSACIRDFGDIYELQFKNLFDKSGCIGGFDGT